MLYRNCWLYIVCRLIDLSHFAFQPLVKLKQFYSNKLKISYLNNSIRNFGVNNLTDTILSNKVINLSPRPNNFKPIPIYNIKDKENLLEDFDSYARSLKIKWFYKTKRMIT